MSKPKKKASPKKESASKKEEGETKKKRRTSKKKERPAEEMETAEQPAAPERLEAEAEEEAEATAPIKSVEGEPGEIEGEKSLGKEAPVEAPVEEAPAVEEEEEEEEGLEIVEEKFYDLNLRRIWTAPRLKRTPRAVRYVREFVAKRMKSDEVSISEEANQLLWARGISKPPRHLRLRVVKDKEDRVIIFPAETAPQATAAPQRVEDEESEAEEAATTKAG